MYFHNYFLLASKFNKKINTNDIFLQNIQVFNDNIIVLIFNIYENIIL